MKILLYAEIPTDLIAFSQAQEKRVNSTEWI